MVNGITNQGIRQICSTIGKPHPIAHLRHFQSSQILPRGHLHGPPAEAAKSDRTWRLWGATEVHLTNQLVLPSMEFHCHSPPTPVPGRGNLPPTNLQNIPANKLWAIENSASILFGLLRCVLWSYSGYWFARENYFQAESSLHCARCSDCLNMFASEWLTKSCYKTSDTNAPKILPRDFTVQRVCFTLVNRASEKFTKNSLIMKRVADCIGDGNILIWCAHWEPFKKYAIGFHEFQKFCPWRSPFIFCHQNWSFCVN